MVSLFILSGGKMKFFRFMFLTALIILSISATAVVAGVMYAYQFSDGENNVYYSELSYRLIEKQMERHIEAVADTLFYSDDAVELRNSITLAVVNQMDDMAFNTKLMTIANKEHMDGYYYEIGGSEWLSSAYGTHEQLIVSQAIAGFRDDIIGNVQTEVVEADGYDYVVYVNRYHNYTDNTSHYIIYYSRVETFANASVLNDLTNGDDFQNVAIIRADEMSEGAKSFENGYISIENSDYNPNYSSSLFKRRLAPHNNNVFDYFCFSLEK
jgi:hypothetical protein